LSACVNDSHWMSFMCAMSPRELLIMRCWGQGRSAGEGGT
jgi:hypothetical protein